LKYGDVDKYFLAKIIYGFSTDFRVSTNLDGKCSEYQEFPIIIFSKNKIKPKEKGEI
jgi:hypothetical protein